MKSNNQTLGAILHSLNQYAIPVFQRYYRADNIDPQRMSGMGIGLYVVQEIVSLHAGAIELTSGDHSGSTFTVCLPALAGSATASVAPEN